MHRNSTVTMYLRGSELKREFMDYRAIPGVQRKLKYLAQLFFPPYDYMRWKYQDPKFSWLPWLYLRRAVEGLVTVSQAFRSVRVVSVLCVCLDCGRVLG